MNGIILKDMKVDKFLITEGTYVEIVYANRDNMIVCGPGLIYSGDGSSAKKDKRVYMSLNRSFVDEI